MDIWLWYMAAVVVYGSGGGIWIQIGGGIWIRIGGGIWIRIQSSCGEAMVVDGKAMMMVRRRRDNL